MYSLNISQREMCIFSFLIYLQEIIFFLLKVNFLSCEEHQLDKRKLKKKKKEILSIWNLYLHTHSDTYAYIYNFKMSALLLHFNLVI